MFLSFIVLSHLHVSCRAATKKGFHLRPPCVPTAVPAMLPPTPSAQAAAPAATADAAIVAAAAAAAARPGTFGAAPSGGGGGCSG